MNPQQILTKLEPGKKFFIGIDSDGCVFDTMEPKQKEFFCPNVIRYFGLLPVSRAARETWEFVNLYSKTRGVNRFIALVKAFDLLKERKDVNSRGFRVPELGPVQRWIEKETRRTRRRDDPNVHMSLNWQTDSQCPPGSAGHRHCPTRTATPRISRPPAWTNKFPSDNWRSGVSREEAASAVPARGQTSPV